MLSLTKKSYNEQRIQSWKWKNKSKIELQVRNIDYLFVIDWILTYKTTVQNWGIDADHRVRAKRTTRDLRTKIEAKPKSNTFQVFVVLLFRKYKKFESVFRRGDTPKHWEQCWTQFTSFGRQMRKTDESRDRSLGSRAESVSHKTGPKNGPKIVVNLFTIIILIIALSLVPTLESLDNHWKRC